MKPKHTIFITNSPSFSHGFLSSRTAAHFTISAQCRNVYMCCMDVSVEKPNPITNGCTYCCM